MRVLHKILAEIVGRDFVLENEPMSRHTTFRVGGPAALYVIPGNESELAEVLGACRNAGIDSYVIGNGSNLLVSDRGYDGVIVEIGKRMSGIFILDQGKETEDDNEIEIDTRIIVAQAGASLAAIASAAREASLTGFEFAGGIPGNLGGACIMNAGAYGGEMKDVLRSVRLIGPDGRITEERVSELGLGYRTSNIAVRGLTVLSAELELEPGDTDEITQTMNELTQKRREKQPLEYPSAGSAFKRPEGNFAGKLIEDSGLKGFAVGGAQVSMKHAGFVINTGDASAQDIYELTEEIIRTVRDRTGVILEREVKLLGEW